jgi:hypothetical protein
MTVFNPLFLSANVCKRSIERFRLPFFCTDVNDFVLLLPAEIKENTNRFLLSIINRNDIHDELAQEKSDAVRFIGRLGELGGV